MSPPPLDATNDPGDWVAPAPAPAAAPQADTAQAPSTGSDADRWTPLYQEAGARHGVDPLLIHALTHVESKGDPTAVSEAGAAGLTQLEPAAASDMGVKDRFNPRQNVFGGTRYLRQQMDNYDTMAEAIAAYHGGQDPANWGPRTQKYVRDVLGQWRALQAQAAAHNAGPDDWVSPPAQAQSADGPNDWIAPADADGSPAPTTKLPPAKQDEGNYVSTAVKPEPAEPTPAVDDLGRPIDTSQAPGPPKPVDTFSASGHPVVDQPPAPQGGVESDELGYPAMRDPDMTANRQWQAPWGNVQLPYQPSVNDPQTQAVRGQTADRAAINAVIQGAITSVGKTIAGGLNYASQASDPFDYRDLSPEDRAKAMAWRQQQQASAADTVRAISEGTDALAKRGAPVDPSNAANLTVEIGRGIGSALPYLPTAVIGGLPAMAGLAFGGGYQDGFEDAKSRGLPDQQAHQQALLTGLVSGGLIEIPGAAWVHGLPGALKNDVLNWGAKLVVHAGTMVTQSQLMQIATNLVAGRPALQGVGDPKNMAATAIVGAGLGAGAEVVRGGLTGRAAAPGAPDLSGVGGQTGRMPDGSPDVRVPGNLDPTGNAAGNPGNSAAIQALGDIAAGKPVTNVPNPNLPGSYFPGAAPPGGEGAPPPGGATPPPAPPAGGTPTPPPGGGAETADTIKARLQQRLDDIERDRQAKHAAIQAEADRQRAELAAQTGQTGQGPTIDHDPNDKVAPPTPAAWTPGNKIRTTSQIQREDGVGHNEAARRQQAEIEANSRPIDQADADARKAGVANTAPKRPTVTPTPTPAPDQTAATPPTPTPPPTTPTATPAPVPAWRAANPDVPTTTYRGSGRADLGSVYNGAAVPVLGPGRYAAFSHDDAKTYGPDVEQGQVDLQNPLVIRSDDEWRALAKRAGWPFPNLFGMTAPEIEAHTGRLKSLVQSEGHDGIIVNWDNTQEGDFNPQTGKGFKVLRNVFDVPQVVDYRGAAPAAPAAVAGKPQSARPVRTERPGTDGWDAAFAAANSDPANIRAHMEAVTGEPGVNWDQLTDEERAQVMERLKPAPVTAAPTAAPTTDKASPSPYIMVDPKDLTVDPERFQYKASGEKGVTGALKGVDKWEPGLANPITVWQGNDGKLYVVNGHQRTDLALRAQAAGQEDVQMPARLYREADGTTPEDMRALGAYQNIAEGSGTAIDAAKVFRQARNPAGMKMPDLPPNSQLVKDGKGLAALSDQAFGMVTNEIVPSRFAARVGELIKDPDQQLAALGVLAKVKPANIDQARLIVQDVANSPMAAAGDAGQGSMFGGDDRQSLYGQRAEVLDNAIRILRGNKSVFGAAVKGEGSLSAAGNQMDTAANQAARIEHERLIAYLQANGTTRGPLSDLLNQFAKQRADGKALAGTTADFLAQSRRLAKDDPGANGVAAQPGADHGGGRHEEQAGTVPGSGSDEAGPGLGFEAPKPPRNIAGQQDIFSAKPKDNPRTTPDVTPPVRGGDQGDLFGTKDAAIQAQAAIDQAGPRGGQKPADQGLFAYRPEGQGDLAGRAYTIPKSQLGDFHIKDPISGQVARSVDLTREVQQRSDIPGQVTAAKFVTDRGDKARIEISAVVDNASGDVIHAATNNQLAGVGFNGQILAGRPDNSVTFHHNHPRGSGFSVADLTQLVFPGLGHVVAHSAGDVFIASAGDRTSFNRGYSDRVQNQMEFVRTTKGAHAIAMRAADRLVDPVFSLRDDNAAYNHTIHDVAARILHAWGHIDYVSSRAMHPDIAAALENDLMAGNRTPAEIAGALKVTPRDEALAGLPQPHVVPGAAHEDERLSPSDDDRHAGPGSPVGRTAGVPEDVGRVEKPVYAGGSGDRAPTDQASGATIPHPEAPAFITASASRLGQLYSKARDLYERGREATNKGMTELLSPIAAGSTRSMAIAQQFAHALRGVEFQFKLVDDALKNNFSPADRLAMGKAQDEQSVLEQHIRAMRDANAANPQGTLGQPATPVMTPAQLAAAEATLRQQWAAAGKGIESLPPNQKAVARQMAALSDQVWQRMQARGLVDQSARGLPYYFARQMLQKDALGNTIRAKAPPGQGGGQGDGRTDIHQFGGNLSTAGPLRRKYLTPEDTLANAKLALNDPNAFMLQDIRAVPQALARNERSIAGKDFIDGIRQIGVATGNNTVLHGEIPAGQEGDYFTIAGHPSFRQWTGSGFLPLHVAKEFEGPIKAVLTQPSGAVFKAVMKAKGASMTAIMWSPLMHLNVELGRSLPLMRGKMLTSKFWTDGARLSRDAGYMQMATNDGLAPIGQRWGADPSSIYDESDPNRAPPGMLGRAAGKFEDFHQKVLWDTVFKLQTGIYDSLRTSFMNRGFDPRTSGIMAAHFANRYAGALPPENLSKLANQTANLFLFSRSFTLGNLGAMKDMINGLPRQTKALIQQTAGTSVADQAASVARRKAWGAVIGDIGLAYISNAIVQQGAAALQRIPSMGFGPAVQSVYDDWLAQAKQALSDTATSYDPRKMLGVFPSMHNEPHKQNRAFLGKDDQGRGIYARLSVGKVGEEFVGWPTSAAEMLMNKLSPWVRPLIEDAFGQDAIGRKIYDPNGSTWEKFGASAVHVMHALGPVDQAQAAGQLVKQLSGHGDPSADPWVQAFRTFLPATGLAQISSGYPGGPESGVTHAEKESQTFKQQQALPAARQLYKTGDTEGAMKALIDTGMDPREARGQLRYMNQSIANASAARWAAKHETPDQRTGRSLLNTGQRPAP